MEPLEPLEIDELVQCLDREGQLLARTAQEAGTDAEVATCPGWAVRDLLRHTGMVHRWATAFVAEGLTRHHPDAGQPDLDGAELLAWFREGHATLVDTLDTAPADVECWTFLPAPSPLGFWARRQAHETTIHRIDAESALGGTFSGIGTAFAVDGIDELLTGFHGRSSSRVRTQEGPRVLRVRATDTDAVWTVRLTPDERPRTERNAVGDADCQLTGPAGRLYPALWNRSPFPRVDGDARLAELWLERSAVTWS
ncbi:maleylpyruvate isomerase family mycothiol-dependent enzyme [Streptomyces sp. NPDC002004]